MNYVGMPAAMHLDVFGRIVRWAFHHVPYLVGSATSKKDGWRDVDVRLILPDDVYAGLDLGEPDERSANQKWVSLCMAYSALGKEMTGLPIDFQIQQMTWANSKYGGSEHERIALGILPFPPKLA